MVYLSGELMRKLVVPTKEIIKERWSFYWRIRSISAHAHWDLWQQRERFTFFFIINHRWRIYISTSTGGQENNTGRNSSEQILVNDCRFYTGCFSHRPTHNCSAVCRWERFRVGKIFILFGKHEAQGARNGILCTELFWRNRYVHSSLSGPIIRHGTHYIKNPGKSRIKEKNSIAHYVPCCTHSWCLSLVHSAESTPEVVRFFLFVQNVYVFSRHQRKDVCLVI